MDKRLAVLTVLLAAVRMPTVVHADEGVTVRVKLHVVSREFSADVIDGAKTEAARIFEQAGVSIGWVDGTHTGGYDLVMMLVASPREATTTSILGAAQKKGVTGYVFYEGVQGFAQNSNVTPAIVVGHVLAHEMGHLLLADRTHSGNGLMRDGWDSSDIGRMRNKSLLFATKEGQALRAAVQTVSARFAN